MSENMMRDDVGKEFLTIQYGLLTKCDPNATEVSIPCGVEDIGTMAFAGCDKLKKVTITSSVKYVGGSAFAGCVALEEIRYRGTVERWNDTQKDSGWSDGMSVTTVHCADGDVPV